MSLSPAQKQQLDAFYLRGLGQFLGMSTTFVDRSNTNYRVYLNAACILLGKEAEHALLPLSEQWSQRRKRLMSFLVSPCATQPEIKATFYFPPAFEFSPVEAINSLWPNISNLVRRRGRPRGQWVREIIAELWRDIRHADPNLPNPDVENPTHRDRPAHYLGTAHPFSI